jgi:hypothetical protein
MEQKPAINVVKNPEIGDEVSKVLLVYDRPGGPNDSMIDFYTGLGYHVHQLMLNDDMFPSIGEFNKHFEPFVREARKKGTYAFGIVHFCANEELDYCDYCESTRQKNALILKQAFACLYASWGREKMAIVTSEPCCLSSLGHLPHHQVEDMVCYYDSDQPKIVLEFENPETHQKENQDFWYPQNLWSQLQQRIELRQLIEQHQKDTRHTLLTQKEVPVEPEKALSSMDVLELIGVKFQNLPKPKDQSDTNDTYIRRMAYLLDMKPIQWEEHLKRSGGQALFLILKRTVTTTKNGYERIAAALEKLNETGYDLPVVVTLCRDFHASLESGKETFLSSYPELTNMKKEDGSLSRTGPWKDGVEKPIASEGTHLDKVKEQFIPPYLRQTMQQQQNAQKSQQEIVDTEIEKQEKEREAFEREAKRLQELDRKHTEREFNNVGGYSNNTMFMSKRQGASVPPPVK